MGYSNDSKNYSYMLVWKKQRPKEYIKMLESVKEKMSDFVHMETNEDNFDVEKYEFIYNAYKNKKYAFVSDMVRLLKLRDIGGIYLDTDVEVLQPFYPILDEKMFIGYMWDCNLGTAVIGAQPHHPIIEGLVNKYIYHASSISLTEPNNDIFTRYFLENVNGFCLNGKEWAGENVHVFNKYSFEHPSFLRRKNFTVHKFQCSWKNENKLKRNIKIVISYNNLGLFVYRKYICMKSNKLSPFYSVYSKKN